MYLNTLESIELGAKIHQKYGSWDAARKAGAVKALSFYELLQMNKRSLRAG